MILTSFVNLIWKLNETGMRSGTWQNLLCTSMHENERTVAVSKLCREVKRFQSKQKNLWTRKFSFCILSNKNAYFGVHFQCELVRIARSLEWYVKSALRMNRTKFNDTIFEHILYDVDVKKYPLFLQCYSVMLIVQ